jgi:hypothetical protein
VKYLLFILLLVAVIITAGCVGENKNTVVTPTPQIVYVTVLVTPTQQTNSQLENDQFFISRTVKYGYDIALETNQISNAAFSQDYGTMAIWSSELISTCSDATIELSAIRVSPELQPTKDEFLSAVSDLKKAGASIVTAVDYYNQGQISLAVSYLEQGNTYTESANAKLKTLTQLAEQYKSSSTTTSLKQVPTTIQPPSPKYKVGDIIGGRQSIIIIDYNSWTDRYQYDKIFQNNDGSWGYRLYPDYIWENRLTIERNNPSLQAHLDPSKIITKFHDKEAYQNWLDQTK